MYVYNRSRLMGLDYILNIYCYSVSHASCEANHQVKKTINARRGVGAWRVVLKWCLQHVKFATRTNQVRIVLSRNFFECLQREISSFLLSRVDITGLQIINSTTRHAPRATPSIYCSVLPIRIFDCNRWFWQLPDDCLARGMKLWVATNVQDLLQFHLSTSILL